MTADILPNAFLTIDAGEPEYSVAEFYSDGSSWDYLTRDVVVGDAVRLALTAINSREADNGMVSRVIICDREGFTRFEWKFGRGITYPKV